MVTVRWAVEFAVCSMEFDANAVEFDACAVEFDACAVDEACDDAGCTCDDEGCPCAVEFDACDVAGGGTAAGMTWNVYVGAVCRVFAGCTSMGRLDKHSDGVGMGQLSEAVCWRYASAFWRSSMDGHISILIWYGAEDSSKRGRNQSHIGCTGVRRDKRTTYPPSFMPKKRRRASVLLESELT